jgi:hypothetical protein
MVLITRRLAMSSNINAVQMVTFIPIKELGREYENLMKTETASYQKFGIHCS